MPNVDAYCTVDELKAQIEKSRATDDAWLAPLILAASRAIDNLCNRPDGFTSSSAVRIFVGSGLATQRIDECTDVTVLAVKEALTDTAYTAWLPADYRLFRGDPRFPDFNNPPFDHLMVTVAGDQAVFTGGQIGGRSYQDQFFAGHIPTRLNYNPRAARGEPTVQVTALWGYADTVPAPIREACIMQSARWYKRLQSSMADALADGQLGQLLFRQTIDPEIRLLLQMGRYIRPMTGRR